MSDMKVKMHFIVSVAIASACMAYGCFAGASSSKRCVRRPNFDESKIPPYSLEDPLTFVDGRKVTKANWPERRREILDIFAREMYGVEPPMPEAVVTELADEKVGAVAGFAIRRQYRMWFRRDKTGPCLNLKIAVDALERLRATTEARRI